MKKLFSLIVFFYVLPLLSSELLINQQDSYKYGYIFSLEQTRFQVPSHYRKINSNLWIDYRLDYHIKPNIIILGLAVDTADGESRLDVIANRLSKSITKSEQAFFKASDQLCGRYVIFFKTKKRGFQIITDALGTKPCFYSEKKAIVASHAKLLADNLEPGNAMVNINFSRPKKFPGRFTPYHDVYCLTPNTTFAIPLRKVRRFYPSSMYHTIKAEKARAILADRLEMTLKGLQSIAKRHGKKVLLALSGGLDSRVTLAISKTKSLRQTEVITHDIHPMDVHTAQYLCVKTNTPHTIIRPIYLTQDQYQELTKLLHSNAFYYLLWGSHSKYRHSFANPVMLQNYKDRVILLLSSGGKIWKTNPYFSINFQLIYLYRYMLNLAPKDFFHTTQLHLKKLRGYDVRELFYWEQHIGVKHAQELQENDVVGDSFLIYNSREVIDTFLSIPSQERETVSKMLVAKFYKMFARLPFYTDKKK